MSSTHIVSAAQICVNKNTINAISARSRSPIDILTSTLSSSCPLRSRRAPASFPALWCSSGPSSAAGLYGTTLLVNEPVEQVTVRCEGLLDGHDRYFCVGKIARGMANECLRCDNIDLTSSIKHCVIYHHREIFSDHFLPRRYRPHPLHVAVSQLFKDNLLRLRTSFLRDNSAISRQRAGDQTPYRQSSIKLYRYCTENRR